MKKGILLQGPVSEWTIDIVNEYKENFEDNEKLKSVSGYIFLWSIPFHKFS